MGPYRSCEHIDHARGAEDAFPFALSHAEQGDSANDRGESRGLDRSPRDHIVPGDGDIERREATGACPLLGGIHEGAEDALLSGLGEDVPDRREAAASWVFFIPVRSIGARASASWRASGTT